MDATKVKLSEAERLEARQKKLDEARKENAKKLKAAKRREARKQAQAKKAAEQAEAVLFVEFCKQHPIWFGKDEGRYSKLAYDWLLDEFEKWKAEAQKNGDPRRAQ